jgi:hypothetical protein
MTSDISGSSNSGIAGPSNSTNKSGWRKTIVAVALIAALTILAWRDPQYTGEVVVSFLGIIGIHHTTT